MDWKLELVTVPVSDVARAKSFYADQLGFVVDHDTQIGDLHVVQLTPPGSGCSINLSTGGAGAAPGAAATPGSAPRTKNGPVIGPDQSRTEHIEHRAVRTPTFLPKQKSLEFDRHQPPAEPPRMDPIARKHKNAAVEKRGILRRPQLPEGIDLRRVRLGERPRVTRHGERARVHVADLATRLSRAL